MRSKHGSPCTPKAFRAHVIPTTDGCTRSQQAFFFWHLKWLLVNRVLGGYEICHRDTLLEKKWQREIAVLGVNIIECDCNSRSIISTRSSSLAFLQVNNVKVFFNPLDLILKIPTGN